MSEALNATPVPTKPDAQQVRWMKPRKRGASLSAFAMINHLDQRGKKRSLKP